MHRSYKISNIVKETRDLSVNIVCFFFHLKFLRICLKFLFFKIHDAILSKWCQSLGRACTVFAGLESQSFKINLSCSQMRRLYSTKIKKQIHVNSKNEEKLEEVNEKNFQNSRFMRQISIVKFRYHSLPTPSTLSH